MRRLFFLRGIAALSICLAGAVCAQTKPETDVKPKYSSYAEMVKSEKLGVDFKVDYRSGSRSFLVAAPHGGAIEPGASEIADAIAGDIFGYYSFSGLKRDSSGLFIPSTRFDEPEMKGIGKKYNSVVAVHVIDGSDRVVFISGNNRPVADAIAASLTKLGYEAKTPDAKGTTGFLLANFVNKSGIGGVQIEITSALVNDMFRGPVGNVRVRQDPSRRTAELGRFVQGVRVVLQQAGGSVGGVTFKPKEDEKPTAQPAQATQPSQPTQPPRRTSPRSDGRGRRG